jgi:uncharacterized PurR-regulated membrane protein YhhQ (DUF165 family)
MQKEKRVVLWLAFSVLFALAPLFVNFLLIRDHPDFGLSGLYDRGELFLVSSVLAADAVGRLFGRSSNRSLLLILCLICAVFLLFASSVEFGIAAPKLDAGIRLTPAQARDSLYEFIGTVVTGFGAVLTEE